MPTTFYLRNKNSQAGPLTPAEVEARYRAREVDGDTPARIGVLPGMGWEPLRNYFPHFHSRSAATKSVHHEAEPGLRPDNEAEQATQSKRDHAAATVRITCVQCGETVVLDLSRTQNQSVCLECQTEYQSICAAREPNVFLVIPAMRKQDFPEGPLNQGVALVTPEVRMALRLFELSEEVSFREVRQAYRRKLKEYHPDKVANLGEEIQTLALSKTRELTSAYRVLERAFLT